MSNQSQILNPLTPMLYLPPDIAYQFKISTYFIIGSVGALIWDILSNIDLECRILFKERVTFPSVAYFLSRSSVLTYSLLNVTLQAAPLGKLCLPVEKAICVMFHITFSSTSLLFLLRVRAVFHARRYVIIFFFMLWLAVLGASLTIATGSNGAAELRPTRYCQLNTLKSYIAAAPITLTVFDTVVFLAISWHLLVNSFPNPHRKPTLKNILLGNYIPTFSRAMVQDGQVYYLISVTSNLAVIAISFIPGISPVYRYMFMFNCTLTNMMACKVFRDMKFDISRRLHTSSIHSSVFNTRRHSGSMDHGVEVPVNANEPHDESSNVIVALPASSWHAKAVGGVIIIATSVCLVFCIPRKSLL